MNARKENNSPQESFLKIENLTIKFRTDQGKITALEDVSFEMFRGEIFGLVGESGSGKSVTALSIMQLLEENCEIPEGSIIYNGENILDKSESELRNIRGGEISMIFQDALTALNPSVTAGEQIAEAIRLHQDLELKTAKDEAIELMDEVGISDVESRYDDYPHEFSGGMRQRITIAIALSCEPSLLIADEPATGLDVTIQAKVINLLQNLSDDYNLSILFITHNIGVVAQICDRFGVMYSGNLVEVGSTDELFTNTKHPYTKGLLQSVPSLKSNTSKKSPLSSIEGTIPAPEERPSGCKFHPRCPHSKPKCKQDNLALESTDGGRNHLTRCIRWNSIDWDSDDRNQSEADFGKDYTFQQNSLKPLIKVEKVKKWFDSSDSHLDKITFQKNSRSKFPIKYQTEYIKAVNNVSFELNQGEILGIVGESGCGKSTLAQLLVGLHDPSDGEIRFRNKNGNLKNLSELERNAERDPRSEIQFVFQDPNSSLNPQKTVGELIGRPIELHNIATGNEKIARIEELLETVRLDKKDRHQYPHEFSGGQQQRIAIARAISTDPDILVADEITSGLDVSIQAQIINLLFRLQNKMDLTILLVTHDLRVASHICDRVVVMYLGEIMEIGKTSEVFQPPYHPYTHSLISSIPKADSAIGGEYIKLEGTVPSAIDPPNGCVFHTRCPKAIQGECDIEKPDEIKLSESHRIKCVLGEEALRETDRTIGIY